MILKLPLLLMFLGISCATNANSRHHTNKQGQEVQGGQRHVRQVNNKPNEEQKGPTKPYIFSYGVNGDKLGGNFGQHEESDGKTVKGAYVVNLPDGRQQVVSYTAGEGGFQADVQYVGEAQYPQMTQKSPPPANQNELIKGEHTQNGYKTADTQRNHRAQPNNAQETNIVHNHQGPSPSDDKQNRRQNIPLFPNRQLHLQHFQPEENHNEGTSNEHSQQRNTQDHPRQNTQVNYQLHNQRNSPQSDHSHNPHQEHHATPTYRNKEQSSPPQDHHIIYQNQPRKNTNHQTQNIHPNQGIQNSYKTQKHNNNNDNNNDNNNENRFHDNRDSKDYHDSSNSQNEHRNHNHNEQHTPNRHDNYDEAQDNKRYSNNQNKHNQDEDHERDYSQHHKNHNDNNNDHDRQNDHGHDRHNNHGHDRPNDHEENHNRNRHEQDHDNEERHDHFNHGNRGHDRDHDHNHNHQNENKFTHGQNEGDASDRKEQSSGKEKEDHGTFDSEFFRPPKGFGQHNFH